MAKILVCDDAEFMRMTIREAMEEAGHEVAGEADDGETALALYEKVKPDLVTMDLLMKTSGVDAVRKIREFDPHARIVIITVLSDQEAEVVKAIRAGASGIVTKPIARDALVAEVNRVLEEQ